MIADTLVPMLRERFPERGLRVETHPRLRFIFPAAHQDVGDILIYDDGDEITLHAGVFTHGHFSNYDAITDEQKAQLISEDVVNFLTAVFADRVVFWGSRKGGGGWRRLDIGSEESPRESEYVWSGPTKTQ